MCMFASTILATMGCSPFVCIEGAIPTTDRHSLSLMTRSLFFLSFDPLGRPLPVTRFFLSFEPFGRPDPGFRFFLSFEPLGRPDPGFRFFLSPDPAGRPLPIFRSL